MQFRFAPNDPHLPCDIKGIDFELKDTLPVLTMVGTNDPGCLFQHSIRVMRITNDLFISKSDNLSRKGLFYRVVDASMETYQIKQLRASL